MTIDTNPAAIAALMDGATPGPWQAAIAGAGICAALIWWAPAAAGALLAVCVALVLWGL